MPPDSPSSRPLSRSDLMLLQKRRPMIEAALDRCLTGDAPGGSTGARPAKALFGLLLHHLATGATPAPDALLPFRRHASRFGDALRAILDDVIGKDGSTDLSMRCVDAFWTCLRLAARPMPRGSMGNITANS